MPMAKITRAPIMMATNSEGGQLSWKALRNAPRAEATPRPARMATKIAAPPRVGVGTAWTLRSSGTSTAPRRRDSFSTAGVSTYEVAALAKRTSR